jgi:hypothetical protein
MPQRAPLWGKVELKKIGKKMLLTVRNGIASSTRTTVGKQSIKIFKPFGFDEKVTECRVSSVSTRRLQNNFTIACHFNGMRLKTKVSKV